MSERCVFYLRVSTDIQDNERQKLDLEEFAKTNSFIFDKDDFYQDNLSGFKRSEERPDLTRMLDDVIKKQIKIVLVWEITRLSRNQTELLKFKEFFITHSINIYFYQQLFWLLDTKTYKITPQASLLITFFGWQAESEAKLTKDRFHSAKKKYVKQGKYNGGKITFGYTIAKFGKTDDNNDKKFIIDNELIEGLNVSKADIVQEMFDLYENGKTCSKICLYSKSKGYPKKVCSPHTLARLLRNTSYVGFKDVKLGTRPTPPIISEAQFTRVGQLLDSNKTKADKGRKHVYLLRGVLKCSICGKYYLGKQTDDAYMCSMNSQTNKIIHETSCEAGNISISNIDGIIWERIKEIWIDKKLHGLDEIFEFSKIEIDDLNSEIDDYKRLLQDNERLIKKTNNMYRLEALTDEQYEKELTKINKEKDDCNSAILQRELEIRKREKAKKNANKTINRKKKIDAVTDRSEMQSIIKSLIRHITFYKTSLFKTIIYIHYQNGKNETILYNSVSRKGNKYKLFNSKCISYNKLNNNFYLLKKKYYPLHKPNITLQERAKLKLKYGIDENVNNNKSDIYDFDTLMKLSDIPNIITTKEYSKITYFKELNIKRFNRKR